MKIYPKILLSVLPMIIIAGLGAYILTATLSSQALTDQSKALLSVELDRALNTTESYSQLLTQYGLEDAPASVRQAQLDATAELQQIKVGKGGYVMAVDQEGTIVFHPDVEEVGMSVSQESWLQNMQPQKTGEQVIDFQNISYLAEYGYFSNWGWYVLAVEPEAEILQPIQQALNLGILLIVIVSGVVLALLAWLMKRTLQPLQLVLNGAARVRQGDYEVQILVDSKDEMGVLADVFNQTVAQIQEHIVALRKSEERYSALFNEAPDGIFISDLDGNYVDVNESGCQMVGYTHAEILQMTIRDLVTPELNPEPNQFDELKAGKTIFVERALLHHDGHTVSVELNARKIGDDRIKASVRDITQRKQAEIELSEAQEHLTLAVRSGNVGLWDWDLLSNEVYYSTEWKNQLGYENHEISNDFSEWESRVHPDDLERAMETVNAYLEKPYPNFQNEFRMRHKDGSYRWILAQASLIYDAGKTIRMVGSHVDVTIRKQADAELHETDEKYRLILENSMDAILLTAPDGRIISVNQAACQMFGYNETEFLEIGRNLVVDATDPRLPEALAKRERTGSFRGELTLIRNGGIKFPAEVSSVIFTDRNGQLMTSMIIRDITDSKTAEDALRESEEKFRNLVEQLPAIVYVDLLDGNGTNLFISSKLESIFGVSEQEWLDGDLAVWANRIHPEDRQRVVDAYLQLSETGQLYNEEYRIITPDDKLLWIHDKGDVLRDNEGNLILHGVMFDITAIKQGETEREELLHVLEASLNEVYIFDPDTLIFEYVNRGAQNNLGYPFEKLKTMTPLDIKPEFTETAFRELIAPMIQQEQEKTIFQTVHQRADGSLYPTEVHLQLVENPGRRVFLAIILDITERKKAEEALQAAEQDYRSIFENASIGIFRSTLEGRFLKVNETMAEMYGYASPDDMIQSITDISKQIHPNASTRDHFQKLIEEYGYVLNLENPILRKDGSLIWTSTSARAAKDEAGKILYYEGFISDITQSKKAEEALRNSEKQLEEAQRIAHLGSWNWLAESDMPVWSKELCAILDVDPDQPAPGMAEQDKLYTADSMVRMRTSAEKTMQTGEPYEIELEHVRKDGSRKWLLARGERWLNEQGETIGLRGTALDITESKQAEQEILQLTRLYATLSQVNQTIVHVKTQQELFDDICEVATQFGGFQLAWVGLLDGDNGEVIRTAQAGESIDYIKNLRINIHDPQMGNGPTARAFRLGQVQIIDDVETDESMIPWRENARKYALRSSAAMPLRLNEKVIGTLTLYSDEPNFFTESELQLLGELGLDISFALEKIKIAEEHEQAVEQLRQNEALYRSVFSVLSEGLVVQDTEDKIMAANESAARILGLTADQLLGKDSHDPRWMATNEDGTPFKPEDHPSMITIKTGQPVDDTIMKVNVGDGFRSTISINSRPIHDEKGDVSGVVVSFSDITKRHQAEEQIKQQLERLKSLHTIDIAISSTFDLKTTLNIILEQVISNLTIDACAILLFNSPSQTLEHAASRGFQSNVFQRATLRTGSGFAGRVVLERNIIHIPNLMESKGGLSETLHLANERFADYFGVPLIVKGEVKGVLEIYHRALINPDSEWYSFLETLATQTAIAIDSAQLFEGLQRSNFDLVLAYDATIEGWSRALDLRDKETEGHTQRVTNLTVRLAQQMGIPDADILHIRRGGLLHDIGKMGIPDRILLKPDKLDADEWNIMKKHTLYANDMLSPIAYLKPALDIPLYHHEKWDGSGYPYQLKEEQIPLPARIFAVVDVWDALTSDRPYRPAWPKEETIEFIREQSGKHFDPQVVDAFLNLMKD